MKRRNSGMFLTEARRAVSSTTGPITSSTFKKGERVRLAIGDTLPNAELLAVQYFPAGTIGRVLGQDGEKLIVYFEGESWEVSAAKLRPFKGRSKQH